MGAVVQRGPIPVPCAADNGYTIYMERIDRQQFAKDWVELPVTGTASVP